MLRSPSLLSVDLCEAVICCDVGRYFDVVVCGSSTAAVVIGLVATEDETFLAGVVVCGFFEVVECASTVHVVDEEFLIESHIVKKP